MKNNLSKSGFIVCQVLVHGSLQPIFSDDNGLMFFDTKEAAQAEIKDCIDSVEDAIKRKDMSKDSRMTNDDYEILAATLTGETIDCISDGTHYKMNRQDDDWQEYTPEDLFEAWETLPQEVQDVLEKYGDENSYESCAAMLEELKPLGYTFEYYLDAVPFNLTKMI